MSDYISREALIDRLNKNLSACNHGTFSEMCYADAIETVKNLPAADVEPVVHGAWYPRFEDWRQQQEGNKCSVCGFEYYGTGIRSFHYCPNCGAKMCLEDNDES